MSNSNSTKSCFICNKSVALPNLSVNSNAGACQKFLVLVSRFLDLNPSFVKVRMTLNTEMIENGTCGGHLDLCEECFPAADSFCDLYDLFQHLKLEMYRSLENVAEIIRRNPWVVKPNAERQPPDEVCGFKNTILEQVEKKKRETGPELKLKKIEDPCLPSSHGKNCMKKAEWNSSQIPVNTDLLAPKEVQVSNLNEEVDVTGEEDEDLIFESPDFYIGDMYSSFLVCELVEPEDISSTCNAFQITTGNYPVVKKMKTRTPSTCKICSKEFGYRYSLVRHMRCHTGGEKRFECTTCNKRFYDKGSLNGHILTHTGEKPYGCTLCLQHFRTKSCLKRHHMRIHMSDNGGNGILGDKMKETQQQKNSGTTQGVSES